MNTVAHLIFNLVTVEYPKPFYSRPKFLQKHPLPIAPMVWGAFLPDLPMVVLYVVERFILGRSDDYIWRTAYYSSHWSNFIDLFNSIPLIAVGLIWSFWQRSRWGWLLGMGMLFHALGDLPLHHDDGHRHFFPISDWIFASPVSYWDLNHYGGPVSILEAIAVLGGCWLLYRSYQSRRGKAFIALIMGLDSLLLVGLMWRVLSV